MKKIELLSKLLPFLLFYTCCFSCNSRGDKNKSLEKKVSMICLKDNGTIIYLKIMNNSDSTVFIPEYTPNFTDNDDTLHLEAIAKTKYNIAYYYKYKHILPFEFYTAKKIEGYKPDTIERFMLPLVLVNQFRLRPMLSIKPGSSSIVKLQFGVPKYPNIAQIVYYKKPFLNADRLARFDYTYGDFLKFDSLSAFHISSPILIRYR